jgi:NTE family protein
MKKKSVSLVLGSGGARGIAHLGIIDELLDRGYHIHSVTGSSIGSLIGAVYATGHHKEFLDWMISLNKIDVYHLMDFTFNLGFVKAEKVFDQIKKMCGEWQIEDLPIKLTVVAVDIKKRKEIVFSKGNLYDAVRASIAYPTIITPHSIDELFLVDGGLMNPVPVNHAPRIDGDFMLAVDLDGETPEKLPKTKLKKGIPKIENQGVLSNFRKFFDPSSEEAHLKDQKSKFTYWKLMEESLNTMQRQITLLTLKSSPPDVLIPIAGESASTFEFFKSKELYEYGRLQAKLALDEFEAES